MADAVWGIDVGQCALKALRCRRSGDGRAEADAFDYIEYPKILSQPESDPVALVREALALFLSRNTVRGDKVAISVSGQSGLARFIKLPPVESKKIPDIVKYEARQQIPFALEDVVWDYQQLAGGSVAEGFALETEVGLFAMKRDQVYRAVQPFTDAGIEVEYVQLTPLAIYNFVAFDQLNGAAAAQEYDPENPPPSLVVLSFGTDTTDLVVTNGFRVWQRSIPVGGNHFTKALSKELKLTFAKAEQMKRNATQAEDPKAVFQAMRPVFSDLLAEISRSVGYFSSIDRKAKISRVVALGNPMKLHGLQVYLQKHLGYDVSEIDTMRSLDGPAVVAAPAFKENVPAFGVAYGLALQGLGSAKIATNLLPREIMTQRMIRAKRPWAVAAVAALLMACTVSFLGFWRSWNSVAEEKYKEPAAKASSVKQSSDDFVSQEEKAKSDYNEVSKMGADLLSSSENRVTWLEMLTALDQCLPTEAPDKQPPAAGKNDTSLEKTVSHRERLYIDSIDAQHFEKFEDWFTADVEKQYKDSNVGAPAGSALAAATAAAPPADAPASESGTASATSSDHPPGDGWMVRIKGFHFHNDETFGIIGAEYIRQTLLKKLDRGQITLPAVDGKAAEKLSVKELGISFPVLVNLRSPEQTNIATATGATISLRKYGFEVQLWWQPTPSAKRQAMKKAVADAAAKTTASKEAAGAPQ